MYCVLLFLHLQETPVSKNSQEIAKKGWLYKGPDSTNESSSHSFLSKVMTNMVEIIPNNEEISGCDN